MTRLILEDANLLDSGRPARRDTVALSSGAAMSALPATGVICSFVLDADRPLAELTPPTV
jgi:hypothetical protein